MVKKGLVQLLFIPILLVVISCMCTNPLDIPSPEAAATAAAKVLPPGQPGQATEVISSGHRNANAAGDCCCLAGLHPQF